MSMRKLKPGKAAGIDGIGRDDTAPGLTQRPGS